MQQNSTDNAEEARPELPQIHQYPPSGRDEPDPLVYCVQIILRRDVVLVVVFIMVKLYDRGQVYRGVVEWYQPDAEDLEY